MSSGPLIAVTIGDPGGVGPEVVVRALCDPSTASLARWLVLGDPGALELAARLCALDHDWGTLTSAQNDTKPGSVRVINPSDVSLDGPRPAAPDASNGRASLDYLHAAIALIKGTPQGLAISREPAHAIVTGPICKEAWMLAGETRFPGHTELFSQSFGSPNAAMMFAAEPEPGEPSRAGLYVILVTAHVPLALVPKSLTSDRILDVITLGARTMKQLGFDNPRVAVCGLNPHAGENGVLGNEDEETIAPAIAQARTQGLDVTGPHPGDTVFPGSIHQGRTRASRSDLVVAMYHDQGLIPVKLLAFDRAVNLTAGLSWNGVPVVRTSPDHGTAFDIASRYRADPGSMKAALRLASRLSGCRADAVGR